MSNSPANQNQQETSPGCGEQLSHVIGFTVLGAIAGALGAPILGFVGPIGGAIAGLALGVSTANKNTETANPAVRSYEDVSPEDMSLSLMQAAYKGDVLAVERLLRGGADVNAKQDNGWTPLMFASQGHVAVVKVLLDRGADIEARTPDGSTPLMVASSQGHVEVAKVLLAKGADVNARDNSGYTALVHASSNRHLEVAKLLKARGGMT